MHLLSLFTYLPDYYINFDNLFCFSLSKLLLWCSFDDWDILELSFSILLILYSKWCVWCESNESLWDLQFKVEEVCDYLLWLCRRFAILFLLISLSECIFPEFLRYCGAWLYEGVN